MAPATTASVDGDCDFLSTALSKMRQRHASVLSALSTAQHDLERAKMTVAELSSEEATLRAHCEVLDRDVSLRQAARVRKRLAHFPEELLQAIFLAACDYATVWDGGYEYWGQFYSVMNHAAPPFMLAAVNRRWRATALRTSGIWTFIGVPRLDGVPGTAYLDYVSLVLNRSGSRPVDILLRWTKCTWENSAMYPAILDALSLHTHRWRRMTVYIPVGTPMSAFRFLRLPLPLLEDLYLGRANEGEICGFQLEVGWGINSPAFLPFCPALRRLRSGYIFAVPQLRCGDLEYLSLHLDNTIPTHIVWNLLRMSPTLRSVRLAFRSSFLDDPQPTSADGISLPHLHTLGLHGEFRSFLPWIMAIDMPELSQFCTVNLDVLDVLVELFDRVADRVTTLVLEEIDEEPDDVIPMAEAMPRIRRLHGLRRVVFRECMALAPDVPATFASRSAAGLPRLEDVLVEYPEVPNDDHACLISSLMQAIHAHAVSGADDAVSFSLVADKNKVPGWLLQQYTCLYGNEVGKEL